MHFVYIKCFSQRFFTTILKENVSRSVRYRSLVLQVAICHRAQGEKSFVIRCVTGQHEHEVARGQRESCYYYDLI